MVSAKLKFNIAIQAKGRHEPARIFRVSAQLWSLKRYE